MNPNMEKTLEELNEAQMQQIQLIQTMDKRGEDGQMNEEQMRQLDDKYFDNILDSIEAEIYEQKLEVKSRVEEVESAVESEVDPEVDPEVYPMVTCPRVSNVQVSTLCQNNNCVVDCGDKTKVNSRCLASAQCFPVPHIVINFVSCILSSVPFFAPSTPWPAHPTFSITPSFLTVDSSLPAPPPFHWIPLHPTFLIPRSY